MGKMLVVKVFFICVAVMFAVVAFTAATSALLLGVADLATRLFERA